MPYKWWGECEICTELWSLPMGIIEDNYRAFLDSTHELQRMGRILKGVNTEGHLGTERGTSKGQK